MKWLERFTTITAVGDLMMAGPPWLRSLAHRNMRGAGGGWMFISFPVGSRHLLDEMEMIYVKRETSKAKKSLHPTLIGTLFSSKSARVLYTYKRTLYSDP